MYIYILNILFIYKNQATATTKETVTQRATVVTFATELRAREIVSTHTIPPDSSTERNSAADT